MPLRASLKKALSQALGTTRSMLQELNTLEDPDQDEHRPAPPLNDHDRPINIPIDSGDPNAPNDPDNPFAKPQSSQRGPLQTMISQARSFVQEMSNLEDPDLDDILADDHEKEIDAEQRIKSTSTFQPRRAPLPSLAPARARFEETLTFARDRISSAQENMTHALDTTRSKMQEMMAPDPEEKPGNDVFVGSRIIKDEEPRPSLLQQAFSQTVETTRDMMDDFSMRNAGAEPSTDIEIRPIRLTLPHMSPAFHGYRIAHISDIHMDTEMTAERLLEAVWLINQEQPDAVVITGDFVTVKAERYADELVIALRQLTPKDATFAVLGNHDHLPWSDPNIVRWALQESNVVDVSNDVYTLHRDDAMLHIAGVDDVTKGQDRLDLVLQKLPNRGAAILLCHAPDFADVSGSTQRFDLQLSGHSHGGQVSLPFLGAPFLPKNGRKYPAGCYQVNGMYQYTNRGLGAGRPHIRYNCRPEITMLTLRAVSSHRDDSEVIWEPSEYYEETNSDEVIETI